MVCRQVSIEGGGTGGVSRVVGCDLDRLEGCSRTYGLSGGSVLVGGLGWCGGAPCGSTCLGWNCRGGWVSNGLCGIRWSAWEAGL